MTLAPVDDPKLDPALKAALLVAALPVLRALELPHPTAAEVLAKTGITRSRTYELRSAILEALPSLLRSPGRPPKPSPPPRETTSLISQEVIAFLMANPGAVTGTPTRRRYSDRFRHLVVDLAQRHPEVDDATLAAVVGVPVGTILDWQGRRAPKASSGAPEPPAPFEHESAHPRLESILEAWHRWRGGFKPFCEFVRAQLLIPYGNTLIGRILAVYAGRRASRRPGRSPDEKALRDALVAFFPGAQWFEDGSEMGLTLNGRVHKFNWELVVDGFSGALVGCSLGRVEDGPAVAQAFQDGVATTGQAPLALTTDHRPSNTTEEVAAELGTTTLQLETTLGRPQGNAPVEGAFGLFAQQAPPLVVEGKTDDSLAHAILALLLTVWARATNHRPRRDRLGRSRVQLYRDQEPSADQIARAKASLEERRRRQELARKTQEARTNPRVRSLLDETFTRLELQDPTGHIKDAIARYPHDAVLSAIATFEGKSRAGTLPPAAGARYLLGIVRHITERDEGLAIAEQLWQRRLQAHDDVLRSLDEQRQALSGSPEDLVRAYVDHAMEHDGPLSRSFWLAAAVGVIRAADGPAAPRPNNELFRLAARRITATFSADALDRQAAVRHLTAKTLPLA